MFTKRNLPPLCYGEQSEKDNSVYTWWRTGSMFYVVFCLFVCFCCCFSHSQCNFYSIFINLHQSEIKKQLLHSVHMYFYFYIVKQQPGISVTAQSKKNEALEAFKAPWCTITEILLNRSCFVTASLRLYTTCQNA